jgi:cytochrome c biogenesis protein CcmG, thiol:disulfide interchange protein DsbE
MNRFAIPLAIFAVLVVVFAVALKRAPEKQVMQSAMIGKPAPEFTLPDLLQPGATVTNAGLKGQWYLLNVWGTWCVECRAEHSVLLDIQREGTLKIIGLNYKDDDAAAQQWLAELSNPYTGVAVDREGRVAIDFGVYGAPETFLINPAGLIVHKTVGVVTPEAWNTVLKPMVQGVLPKAGS